MKLNPKEIAKTFVAVPPLTDLKDLCMKSAVADIDGPGIKSAITKQVSKFTVCTNDTHVQPPPVEQHVFAELKSLVDDSVLQCTVVSQTPSIYQLSYIPTTRGRHQLTVRINNSEIGTFQVFVHHPPTQLGSPGPVRVIYGMKGPYYIAVGEEELFVTEDHRYTVLNTQGQRVLTIGSKGKPPFGDEYPLGITTDSDGGAYITTEDHKVQTFSRCGELVKTVGRLNAGEFNWPFGIRYHNHKVYVCDSGNG